MLKTRAFLFQMLALATLVGSVAAAGAEKTQEGSSHPKENAWRVSASEVAPSTSPTLPVAGTGPDGGKKQIAKRPAKWAKPIKKKGLPNLAQVSKVLYRGAQPSAEGFKNLEKMGVKTVVNLRSLHSDRKMLKGTKLGYIHITMTAWRAEYKDLVQFLKIVGDKSKQPVFVHCQHGADRTGLVCAVYRVAVENWTADEAWREMRLGGFNYHEIWKNLPRYLKSLDFKKLRKDAGIRLKKKPDGKPGAEKNAERQRGAPC